MNNKTKAEEIKALKGEGLNDISGGAILDTGDIRDMKGHGYLYHNYDYIIVDDKTGRVIQGMNGDGPNSKHYPLGNNNVIAADYLANHPIQHVGPNFDDSFVKGEDGYFYYKPMMK